MGQESTIGTVIKLIAGFDEDFFSTIADREEAQQIRDWIDAMGPMVVRVSGHFDSVIVELSDQLKPADRRYLETFSCYNTDITVTANCGPGMSAVYFDVERDAIA